MKIIHLSYRLMLYHSHTNLPPKCCKGGKLRNPKNIIHKCLLFQSKYTTTIFCCWGRKKYQKRILLGPKTPYFDMACLVLISNISHSTHLEERCEGLWTNCENLTRSVWISKVFQTICRDDSGILASLVKAYYRGVYVF